MEGTCTHRFARTELDKPVELMFAQDTIRSDHPENNLSAGGLIVHRSGLSIGTNVHVRIGSAPQFEADGQVRNYNVREEDTEITFTSLSKQSREALDLLIEDLTRRGLPAA
jgi:hypothetical protein